MWGQSTATTSTTPTTSSGGTPTLSQIQQLQAQQEEREREEVSNHACNSFFQEENVCTQTHIPLEII